MIGWWLVAAAAVALVAIGAGAVVAPRMAAAGYGIVVEDPRALAFIRAMGVRDVAIGALLALLASTRSRALVAWGLYATTLVALLDFVVVAADRPTAHPRASGSGVSARVLHAAGAVGLAVAGALVQAGY